MEIHFILMVKKINPNNIGDTIKTSIVQGIQEVV